MKATSQIISFLLCVLLSGGTVAEQAKAKPVIHPAANLQYTTLQVPGSSSTQAYGVNNNGDIVGTFVSGGITQGFVYTAGAFQTVPCGPAYGINDNGVIVGLFVGVGGLEGYIYQNGSCNSVKRRKMPEAVLNGINNQGLSVGVVANGFNPLTNRGFVYRGDGNFTTIDDLSLAGGINNSNIVSGTRCDHQTAICQGIVFFLNEYRFWHSPERVKFPHSAYSNLGGINDNGQVVGIWGDQSGGQGNFVFDITTKAFTVFQVGESVSSQPEGINNSGEIVGWYYDGTTYYGFFGQLSP